ncbi:hypothetical protein PAPYR_8939 [Paratrimastix pyriformis]|uniref:Sulfhydryl oxidase n=1 Tax=Paratrimastix pyriformis TaxID=342808 RepID=A0ABQ8UC76_9EUKA|nr:hypothetical protein PAPYR_8939 [Paratrimastix pyriformis]
MLATGGGDGRSPPRQRCEEVAPLILGRENVRATIRRLSGAPAHLDATTFISWLAPRHNGQHPPPNASDAPTNWHTSADFLSSCRLEAGRMPASFSRCEAITRGGHCTRGGSQPAASHPRPPMMDQATLSSAGAGATFAHLVDLLLQWATWRHRGRLVDTAADDLLALVNLIFTVRVGRPHCHPPCCTDCGNAFEILGYWQRGPFPDGYAECQEAALVADYEALKGCLRRWVVDG